MCRFLIAVALAGAALIQDEAYRIARELLRNGFQHANASAIEAEIRYEDRLFRLRVLDDGKGIDPETLKEGARAGHWEFNGHAVSRRNGLAAN